jgi:hypothetical protein
MQLYDAMAVTNPPMPELYNKAKLILVACTQIDECKEWADKMAALGSYAKQADDEELEKLAKKIRAQAMKRCGELLNEFDAQGQRNDLELMSGSEHKLSKYKVGENAGMSNRQIKDSVWIANVPDELFNSLVESDTPPTITTLAELGTKKRAPLKNESAFAPAIHFRGMLEDLYNDYMVTREPQFYIDGMEDWQKEKALYIIPRVIAWLDDMNFSILGIKVNNNG